jgi:hypothetical protein
MKSSRRRGVGFRGSPQPRQRDVRDRATPANRRACEGLLWVVKLNASTIEAYCPDCDRGHYVITGWELTHWTDALDLVGACADDAACADGDDCTLVRQLRGPHSRTCAW